MPGKMHDSSDPEMVKSELHILSVLGVSVYLQRFGACRNAADRLILRKPPTSHIISISKRLTTIFSCSPALCQKYGCAVRHTVPNCSD
jgi:hypothetical protein